MTDRKHHCPRCGASAFGTENDHKYLCEQCGFELYKNVAATVSIVLVCGREVLFSKRGREPSAGLLDFPGGFVDPGETLEEALVRELYEELDWQPDSYRYLFSFPNVYPYGGVVYHTADTFFLCEVDAKPRLNAQDDVAELVWRMIENVPAEALAFDSMRHAVAKLVELDLHAG